MKMIRYLTPLLLTVVSCTRHELQPPAQETISPQELKILSSHENFLAPYTNAILSTLRQHDMLPTSLDYELPPIHGSPEATAGTMLQRTQTMFETWVVFDTATSASPEVVLMVAVKSGVGGLEMPFPSSALLRFQRNEGKWVLIEQDGYVFFNNDGPSTDIKPECHTAIRSLFPKVKDWTRF